MKNKCKKLFISLLCSSMIAMMLSGCGIGPKALGYDQVVLTTGFDADEVFRIGDSVCTKEEFKLYLVNTQKRYEKAYGGNIWSVSNEGVTLEDKLKNSVSAQLAQIKTLNLLANEYHVSLSTDDVMEIEKAANEYYTSLNQKELDYLNITQEQLVTCYSEYALAHKVYTYIIRDINPEISDDEARTVTVDWIFIASTIDDFQKKQDAMNVVERARAGEDFAKLATEYSDDDVLTHSFFKGEQRKEIESVAFNLAEGEVSDIILCLEGYYILKCVSTLDREETDINKVKIVEQRKNAAFNDVYDTFAKEQIKKLDKDNWDEIKLISDDAITTDSFFDVYDKYFAEE